MQIPRGKLGTPYTVPWWSAFLEINALHLVQSGTFQNTPPAIRPTLIIDSILTLNYLPSPPFLFIKCSFSGEDPEVHRVKVSLWKGSSSKQRHPLRSELRWICGPTSSSIIPVHAPDSWWTFYNPVFTWSEDVWQALELTPISADGWPGRPYRFHLEQSAVS